MSLYRAEGISTLLNTRSHLNNCLDVFVFFIYSPGIVINITSSVFVSSVGIMVNSGMGIEGFRMDTNEKLQPLQKLFVVGFDLRKVVMALLSDQAERFF